jgi:hypothetical protein
MPNENLSLAVRTDAVQSRYGLQAHQALVWTPRRKSQDPIAPGEVDVKVNGAIPRL